MNSIKYNTSVTTAHIESWNIAAPPENFMPSAFCLSPELSLSSPQR